MKKAISILMSIVLLLGIMPMDVLAASEENTSTNGSTATITDIYATFPSEGQEGEPTGFVVDDGKTDLSEKNLFVRIIRGGTYILPKSDAEGGLPLYLDNARVTCESQYQGFSWDIRLAGDSSLNTGSYTISCNTNASYMENDITNGTVNSVVENYKALATDTSTYTFTQDTTWSTWGMMDSLIVNSDVTLTIDDMQDGENVVPGIIEAVSATINGNVVIENCSGKNKSNTLRILEDGVLTVTDTGTIKGLGNASLELFDYTKIISETFQVYDCYNEETSRYELFTCNGTQSRECFFYNAEADIWMRNSGSGKEPDVSNGMYKVFYDDVARDEESQAGNVTVKSNNEVPQKVNNGANQTFEQDKQIDFTLTPPTHRANVTPIVEIVVRSEQEEVFGSEITGDHKIDMTANEGGTYSFSFVPKTVSGFEVYVWWSGFDRFGSDGNTFVVQVNVRGGGNITFTPASSSSSQPEPGNDGNIKYRFDKSILENNGTLTLAFNPTSGNFLDSVRIENAQYTTSSGPTEGWTQIENGKNNFTIDNGRYSYTINASDVLENSNIFIETEFRSEGGQGGDNQPPNSEGVTKFSGDVYFVWKGSDDKLCYYRIEDLTPITNDSEVINYIGEADIVDQNTNEVLYISDIGNNYYWMWDSAMDILEDYETFSSLQEAFEGRDDTLKRAYAINPLGAKNGNSTICTNGDGAFHATIYSAGFVGVDFDVDPVNNKYRPDYWNPAVYSSTVDISGTTQENPAVFEMFILNNKIHFSGLENVGAAITNVQALGVPSGAVTITGVNGGYDVTFNSNFFDRVILKLTTSSEESYIRIVRTAIQVTDNLGPNMTETPKAIAEVYYSESESYEKYDVYATIYYSDNTSVMKKANVSEIKMDHLGNPVDSGTYMFEGGEGLMYSNYEVEISKDVVGVAFNVVKAGTLTGETYSGSYVGSGDGIYYDPEEREIVY